MGIFGRKEHGGARDGGRAPRGHVGVHREGGRDSESERMVREYRNAEGKVIGWAPGRQVKPDNYDR